MINVYVDELYRDFVNTAEVTRGAEAVLRLYGKSTNSDLTIAVEPDERLRDLNNQFLGINEPTDVLSFPSGEENPDAETRRIYLGDIIISYPRAIEQASTSGHPIISEIMLLVVHGTLHLLGHDHADPESKNRMWSEQTAVLKDLGVQLARLPD